MPDQSARRCWPSACCRCGARSRPGRRAAPQARRRAAGGARRAPRSRLRPAAGGGRRARLAGHGRARSARVASGRRLRLLAARAREADVVLLGPGVGDLPARSSASPASRVAVLVEAATDRLELVRSGARRVIGAELPPRRSSPSWPRSPPTGRATRPRSWPSTTTRSRSRSSRPRCARAGHEVTTLQDPLEFWGALERTPPGPGRARRPDARRRRDRAVPRAARRPALARHARAVPDRDAPLRRRRRAVRRRRRRLRPQAGHRPRARRARHRPPGADGPGAARAGERDDRHRAAAARGRRAAARVAALARRPAAAAVHRRGARRRRVRRARRRRRASAALRSPARSRASVLRTGDVGAVWGARRARARDDRLRRARRPAAARRRRSKRSDTPR